jgi:hypothetical protein
MTSEGRTQREPCLGASRYVCVGRPTYDTVRHEWQMNACELAEPVSAGQLAWAWTAVARSQAGVLREMARCLEEISAGRWPK